jgi:small-conductance mechanosensitive channel
LLTFLLQVTEDPSTADEIEDWVLEHGVTIAVIFVVAIVALIVLERIVPRAVRVTTRQRLAGKPEEEIQQREETLSHVFTRTGIALIVVLAFVTALPELGVNIAPLLAGVGIVGIAVGFGAQSLVKDFLSGIFILIDNQYGKGDVVQIAGISGLVEDVGLRRTVLRDLDGIVHYVPNGEIKVASNFTQEYSRVNLNISVAYDEDLDRVIEVINRVGQELASDPEWSEIILTPPEVLRLDSLGESGIELKVVGDTQPIRQWDVMGELRKRIKRAFDEEGIEIPYPHRVMVQPKKTAGQADPEQPQTEPPRSEQRSETGEALD